VGSEGEKSMRERPNIPNHIRNIIQDLARDKICSIMQSMATLAGDIVSEQTLAEVWHQYSTASDARIIELLQNELKAAKETAK
jgi:hypothetical protein